MRLWRTRTTSCQSEPAPLGRHSVCEWQSSCCRKCRSNRLPCQLAPKGRKGHACSRQGVNLHLNPLSNGIECFRCNVAVHSRAPRPTHGILQHAWPGDVKFDAALNKKSAKRRSVAPKMRLRRDEEGPTRWRPHLKPPCHGVAEAWAAQPDTIVLHGHINDRQSVACRKAAPARAHQTSCDVCLGAQHMAMRQPEEAPVLIKHIKRNSPPWRVALVTERPPATQHRDRAETDPIRLAQHGGKGKPCLHAGKGSTANQQVVVVALVVAGKPLLKAANLSQHPAKRGGRQPSN
mmetsp:Transcript_43309/g.134722  ORF Transcript_43309/g.134722 Transcript_43309/m.134722 type:complete len:291 (-) Transcript_43309:575-1447(-)